MIDSAARFLLVVNACVTVLFVMVFGPTSVIALMPWAAWLTAPHWILLGMLWRIRRSENRRLAALRILTMLVSTGGVLLLASLIFGPPDAQTAMAVLFTPVCQGAAWLGGVLIVMCVPKN